MLELASPPLPPLPGIWPNLPYDEFERVGTRREVQDWQQYTDLLTRWASAAGRFENWRVVG